MASTRRRSASTSASREWAASSCRRARDDRKARPTTASSRTILWGRRARHHARLDLRGSVPGPERREGNARGVRRFWQSDPPLFEGLGGELREQGVPVDGRGEYPFGSFPQGVLVSTVVRGVTLTVPSCHRGQPYQLSWS